MAPPAFVDVHSHCVPSGDDGAQTHEEGLDLCLAAFRRGTRLLYATPHVWPHFPLSVEREEQVRATFERLAPRAGLELRLGWELTPTTALLAEDPVRYVLEDTNFVLMEVPFTGPLETLYALAEHVERAGLRPLIAHPERTEGVRDRPEHADELAERGWLVQVNATSLQGNHGPVSEALAWDLVERGVGSVVASDGHRTARPPFLDDAYALALDRLGETRARPLFDGSPLGLSSAPPTPSRAASPGA